MLDYHDFRYVHRPPDHESTNIVFVIVFSKKGVEVDFQNMRKQGAKVEKLIFNFVDSLVKMIYARH